MEINYIHDLKDLNINNIEELQNMLRVSIDLNNKILMSNIKICAGVDVSYWQKKDKTFGVCSIVIMDFKTKNILKKIYSYGLINNEYKTGHFSARELPLIIETALKIPDNLTPDLFIFDGNGFLHPKNMGIATHASFFLNKPTIGVSKSLIKIDNIKVKEPENKTFSYSFIKINNIDSGIAFRSHIDTNPIFISPGNYIDFETSIECIKHLIDKKSKLPLPTRLADIESNKLRKIYTK